MLLSRHWCMLHAAKNPERMPLVMNSSAPCLVGYQGKNTRGKRRVQLPLAAAPIPVQLP